MRTITVCQEAMQNQELPFDRLVSELKPPRQRNIHPLFQVMFVHQNVPSLYEVPGMQLELVKIDYGTSKFDLNVWVEEVGDELRLTLYYSRELFDGPTAERILSHYLTLLETTMDGERTALCPRRVRFERVARESASNDAFDLLEPPRSQLDDPPAGGQGHGSGG